MSLPRSAFVPTALVLLSMLAWFGAQAWQLHRVEQELRARLQEQAAALRQAERSRRALDAFASRAQALADGGNVPARRVLDELKRRGVTIDALTPALPAPVAGAAPAR